MMFLWPPKLKFCLNAAAYSIRYRFGVGFEISEIMATGLFTKRREIRTSLIFDDSYFFA